MDRSNSNHARLRRFPRGVVWAVGMTAGIAIVVQLSKTGVDVLLLAVLILAVILLERTIGDWLGDLIGSGFATLMLAAGLGLAGWTFFSKGGAADRFFVTAAARGYATLYYQGSASAVRAQTGAPAAALSPSIPTVGTIGGTPAVRTTSPLQAAGSPESPRHEPAPPDRSGAASGGAPSRMFQGWTARRITPAMRVSVPTLAVSGERLVIRVDVTSDAGPAAGCAISFTVNGRPLAIESTGGDGAAFAEYSPRAPGRYEVGAHFGGDDRFLSASKVVRITVLPGK